MKYVSLFFLSLILFVSCNEKQRENAKDDKISADRTLTIDAPESKASAQKEFKQTITFGDVKIELEEKNQKLFIQSNSELVENTSLDLDSKLEAIFETDVNADGYNEFYCITKSGDLIAYASYRNKSFGEIYIPKKPRDIYSVFNELKLWEVKKNHLILTFSNGEDKQINVVRYALITGEAGFRLEVQ